MNALWGISTILLKLIEVVFLSLIYNCFLLSCRVVKTGTKPHQALNEELALRGIIWAHTVHTLIFIVRECVWLLDRKGGKDQLCRSLSLCNKWKERDRKSRKVEEGIRHYFGLFLNTSRLQKASKQLSTPLHITTLPQTYTFLFCCTKSTDYLCDICVAFP